MRKYEVMTIHRPEIPEQDVRSKVKEIEDFLETRGAGVDGVDLWGKRRFAYEIDHMSEGFYSVVSFSAPEHASVEDLDRALGLSDAVVRHKIMRREQD